jgi:hypothetical protein
MSGHEPEENNLADCYADGHLPADEDAPSSLMLDKPTPLPKLQMFILFLIQISEPIAGLVIYPFINQFVRETGITQGDERKTGYYAGIIVRYNRLLMHTYIVHLFLFRNLHSSWQNPLRLCCGAIHQIDLGVDQSSLLVHLA